MTNLYVDTGSVIKSKDRYIQRDHEKIINEVFLNTNFIGSLGITGLHKVGKTTLIEQMLNQNRENLSENNVIYIYIYMANYQTAEDFFHDIVFKLFEHFEDFEIDLHDLIVKKYNRYNLEKTSFNRDAVFRILSKKLDYKILICIDEFDKAITLFKYNSIYFQILRNFPSEFNISMIYISRRDIYYIEEKSPHNSKFAQSFEDHYYMGLYNYDEVEKYFFKLSAFFKINEEIKQTYEKITGFYPYMMDILTKELVKKNIREEELTNQIIENTFKENIEVFEHQYEEIKQVLIEENLYNEMLSILINNIVIDSNKKLLLYKYGIFKNKYNEIKIFSQSFADFILKDINEQNLDLKDKQQLSLYQLVEKIESLISITNDTWKNIHRDVIFMLTHSESEHRKKINTLCINKALFSNFTGALYLTIFERTSINIDGRSKNLYRLPKKFQRSHYFVNLIDSIRHNFGGHDTRSDNWTKTTKQLSRRDILIYLKGNPIELLDDDHDGYIKMQLKLLSCFELYLEELYNFIGE